MTIARAQSFFVSSARIFFLQDYTLTSTKDLIVRRKPIFIIISSATFKSGD